LPRYEQPWAVGLRTSLAERYINAHVELASMLLATDAAAALEHYQAVLAVDPFYAHAVMELMQAHTMLGRRSYALDLYHDYTRRINENGLDPDRAVEQVYRQLLDER
jgi:DNA-binding SARP family transcriptional activator